MVSVIKCMNCRRLRGDFYFLTSDIPISLYANTATASSFQAVPILCSCLMREHNLQKHSCLTLSYTFFCRLFRRPWLISRSHIRSCTYLPPTSNLIHIPLFYTRVLLHTPTQTRVFREITQKENRGDRLKVSQNSGRSFLDNAPSVLQVGHELCCTIHFRAHS